MRSKQNADTYGTAFLEAMNRIKGNQPPVNSVSLRLLRELEAGPEPLQKLQETVNLDFRAFAETLRDMEDAGFLAVRRQGTQDVAELTGVGARIVGLSAR